MCLFFLFYFFFLLINVMICMFFFFSSRRRHTRWTGDWSSDVYSSDLGKFLAVIWENLADPIITGRCEIGHPKLYAEIAEPRRWNGAQICGAGWMGFRFLELEVSQLHDTEQDRQGAVSDGTLMLKYTPRTGAWGETDLCQVTLTPAGDPDNHI